MLDFTFSLASFEYYLLILIRVASFISVAPFFGLQGTPTRVKAGLSAAIALLLYHGLDPQSYVYEGVIGYGILVLREALVGIIIGFVSNLSMYAVGFAGSLIDMQVGMSMAQEYNPMTRTTESISGNLLNYLILLFLITSDLYHFVLKAAADSYELLPIGEAVFNWNDLVVTVIKYATDLFIIGFRISLPVFASMLVVNCILGIMAKVAPQMNMFAVGIQMKFLFGYFVMFLMMSMLPHAAVMISDELKLLVRLSVSGMQGV